MNYLSNIKYISEFTCEFDLVIDEKQITCPKSNLEIERIAKGLINPDDFDHELEVFKFAIEMINKKSRCSVWINFVSDFRDKYLPIDKNNIISHVDNLQIMKINKMLNILSKDIKDDIDIKTYMHLLDVRKTIVNKNSLNAKILE